MAEITGFTWWTNQHYTSSYTIFCVYLQLFRRYFIHFTWVLCFYAKQLLLLFDLYFIYCMFVVFYFSTCKTSEWWLVANRIQCFVKNIKCWSVNKVEQTPIDTSTFRVYYDASSVSLFLFYFCCSLLYNFRKNYTMRNYFRIGKRCILLQKLNVIIKHIILCLAPWVI